MGIRFHLHSALGARPLLRILSLAAFLAASLPLSAQRPPVSFRAGVNAVFVDVRVVDAQGNFVSGLGREDFRLFEDRAAQSIDSFALVDLPLVRPLAGVPLPPDRDTASNADAAQGRLYVLLLDDAALHPSQTDTVRALAREFVERNVVDGDRVAIAATSGRRDVSQEFTGNRRRLLQVIDRFQAGFGPSAPGARTALEAVRSVSSWLTAIPARRKSMVLISPAFDAGEIIRPGLEAWIDQSAELRDAFGAAARGNVSIYAIDPAGNPRRPARGIVPVQPGADRNSGGFALLDMAERMDALASATGGFALVHSNEFSSALDRIADESSRYYMLGYTSTNSAYDDRFRRLSVEVIRPGLEGVHVQARLGYVARDPRPPKAAADVDLAPELIAALRSPIPLSGLPLRAGAMPMRTADGGTLTPIVVEVTGGSLLGEGSVEARGPIELVASIADAGGTRRFLDRTLIPRVDREARWILQPDLKPGRYHLRVAGFDVATMARGSVTFDLDVPDFSKGALTMSGVALSSVASARVPTTGFDRPVADALGEAPPTARREFMTTDELRQHVEIYDNDRGGSGFIDVLTEIRNEAGDILFGRRQSLARNAGPDDHRLDVTIPLKDMPAGPYVLTVEAALSAGGARVTRSVPFDLRSATRIGW
jgi:VWFA-related protein